MPPFGGEAIWAVGDAYGLNPELGRLGRLG